jgi:SAM-dependent methyltransferase
VERLAPQPGERFLDVATGTGAVAALAARAGAEVTGIDLAPGMIEKARRRPEAVEWLIGDARELPFEDGAFDVVASNFGVVFAPEPERAAAELARACRGRLGMTAWRPHPEQEVWRLVLDDPPPAEAWASEDAIRALLEPFDVELEEHVMYLEGETADEIWEWQGRAFPPHRERLRRMSPERIEEARAGVADVHERFRENGRIRYPRPYLLAFGVKR